MSLGAFVSTPQTRPAFIPTPKELEQQLREQLKLANEYPANFVFGTTRDNVGIFTDILGSNEAEHGDVLVVRRSSGTVGVKQFINGDWKTLYNDEEASKKFGAVPAVAPAQAPPAPTHLPHQRAAVVMDVMVIGDITDNSLVATPAENKSVGIVKRASGTVGVKQVVNGKWEPLYTEAEAVKKFGSKTSVPEGQMLVSKGLWVVCEECGLDTNIKDAFIYREHVYCCEECAKR